MGTTVYSPRNLSLSLSQERRPHRRGFLVSAAEPPGCSSPSLSLLDAAAAAAALLLLAPERLRFGTGPHELASLLLALAPPARARFFFFFFGFFFLGGLWEGLVLKTAAGKPSSTRMRLLPRTSRRPSGSS